MNILFLTQILPYPPDAGPKVKTWHVLRYLAGQGHKITLVSFVREEEEKHVETVRALGIEVLPVPIRRSRAADVRYLLSSLAKGKSFIISRDDLPGMRGLVNRLLADRHFDAIHADQLTMTQFALNGRHAGASHPVRIFDAHNATWSIMERMRSTASFYLRPLYALEQGRIKRYEARIVQEFEHTLAVTEIDRELLMEAVKAVGGGNQGEGAARRISVIPIAVDTQALQPAARAPGSLNILTLGTLHYPPNADGIRWFINEVFPAVRRDLPQATLTIIGKNPPADFIQMAAQNPGVIEVTGYVDDLTPYFARAALTVVPVRAGSGMRVRLLEAFARGMPAVTTTIGLEGIEAIPGEDVLVADTTEDFAASVVQLAKDPGLQQRLSCNGRCLAVERYDWHPVLKRLEAIYGEQVG